MKVQTIRCIEDALAIEHPACKEMFPLIDKITQYLKSLVEFLNSTFSKVYVGEGIIVNIDELNESIDEAKLFTSQLFEKHRSFFNEYFTI